MNKANAYAPVVVRWGIALTLLWFGGAQLLDPVGWSGFVPGYIANNSPIALETIVIANAITEIVFGAALLLGVFVRVSALVMSLHIALIALSLGNTSIGVRDWGLAFAAFGIFLHGPDTFSVMGFRKKKEIVVPSEHE